MDKYVLTGKHPNGFRVFYRAGGLYSTVNISGATEFDGKQAAEDKAKWLNDNCRDRGDDYDYVHDWQWTAELKWRW